MPWCGSALSSYRAVPVHALLCCLRRPATRTFGRNIASYLNRYGADAFVVPLAPSLKQRDYRIDAEDAQLAQSIREAGGVYFAGGDQTKITRAAAARWQPHGRAAGDLGSVSARWRDRRHQCRCGHHEQHHV
jgi:hypothetical protein